MKCEMYSIALKTINFFKFLSIFFYFIIFICKLNIRKNELKYKLTEEEKQYFISLVFFFIIIIISNYLDFLFFKK
jgi:hypothetical protein